MTSPGKISSSTPQRPRVSSVPKSPELQQTGQDQAATVHGHDPFEDLDSSTWADGSLADGHVRRRRKRVKVLRNAAHQGTHSVLFNVEFVKHFAGMEVRVVSD